MQKTDIITLIQTVLTEKMTTPNMDGFHAGSRLNEDLYLDSVLLMELLINLELEYGFDIPDTMLKKEDFVTVESLSTFLLRDCFQSDCVSGVSFDRTPQAPMPDAALADGESLPTETPAEFEDIKVHCFVSCLCEIIKANPLVDHRPFYFGVWDAEIVIDEHHQLSYHSDTLNHDFFREWYQKLYAVPVNPWYNPAQPKSENIQRLMTLLAEKTASQQVMVMLDMYRLPERENKFNQDPFPHYVILELTNNPDDLLMLDPDFRWEGILKKDRILHAIASPAVEGGYLFDADQIQPSRNQVIRDYFLACMDTSRNPLTDSVQTIIQTFTQTTEGHQPSRPLSRLADALYHLPVLAIRKYAYEHGFAFFWREMDLDMDEFEHWCDRIEDLVRTYKLIQYRAMKMALSPTPQQIDHQLLSETSQLIARQNQTEFEIKSHLIDVFAQWERTVFSSKHHTTPSELEAL